MTITGNELAYPLVHHDGSVEFVHAGLTLRQLALKDFMCALVSTLEESHKVSSKLADILSKEAALLTDAYINQLNKQP